MAKLAPEEYPVIVRAVVGSQAHGLARPGSDSDYREVFVVPTRELLSLPANARPKDGWQTAPQRGVEDEGGHEVGQFLDLAMRGNPNIVELLWTTIETETADGSGLRSLAPWILATQPLSQAFLGYADNSRKKILSDPGRRLKWQAIYIRTLETVLELFRTGRVEYPVTRYPWGSTVADIRDGLKTIDWVIARGMELEGEIRERASGGGSVLRDVPDVAAVNEWLLDLRLRRWEA